MRTSGSHVSADIAVCMFLYSGHLLLTLLQAALLFQSIKKLGKILLAAISIFCSAAESLCLLQKP